MDVDHRSALPHVPGIPWWGAALVAVALTAIGVAFDAGSGTNALGGVFATCYVLGCVAAVLAVRQSGIFTAVIQPPLILFVAVPFAYFVFHGSTFTGVKDTLINSGYPLIERFPLMFFTSATVLVVGLVRWYLGMTAKRGLPADGEPAAEASDDVAAAAGKLAAKGRRSTRSTRYTEARAARAAAADLDDPIEDEAPRPSRRTPRTPASERSSGAAAGKGSRRSRHSRPAETEIIEPVLDRPRRRTTPPVDSTDEPRRRPRSTEPRTREPREPREPRERRPLPPTDRRGGSPERDRPERERYERPRRERASSYERPERTERTERTERRRPRPTDYEPYEPFEPYEPPVSRTNGGSGTHHPISRVRYRGSEDDELRTEHRTKPRRPRHSAPDSWDG
ncbi:DUF6542 domain-containing protein [Mycolicibacterium sp. P1-18]|uniref:DUF6542 domain-containing protein n=1 Tax=Mycolicibacterium sp. P1-18 TaxID=2024615 RepID=UPI00351A0C61